MAVCLQIFGVKGLLGEVTVVGLRCWTATGVRAGLGRELEGCLGPSQGKPVFRRSPCQEFINRPMAGFRNGRHRALSPRREHSMRFLVGQQLVEEGRLAMERGAGATIGNVREGGQAVGSWGAWAPHRSHGEERRLGRFRDMNI